MSVSRQPVLAVGGILIEEDKVLLVLRAHEPARGQWAIPGGKVKIGESLEQALIREIREETGLNVEVSTLVTVFERIDRDSAGEVRLHYVVLDYEVRRTGGRLHAADDALQVRWFGRDELNNNDVTDSTRELLQKKYNF